jgi:hypothetical protein
MSPEDIGAWTAIAVAALGSPWVGDWLKNKYSKTSNKVIIDAVHKIDFKVDCNWADSSRQRILRFNGEIRRGVRHDEEEFNDVLDAIDDYERFCHNHPDYPNSKAVQAIANIKRVYDKCIQENCFK